MFSNQFSNILHLSNNEQSVLDCLSTGEQSVSELSRITKTPRTTLYTTIDTLIHRGLAIKRKVKHQTIVSLADRSKIDAILFNEVSYQKSDSGWLRSPNFKIIHGLPNLIGVYEKICSNKNKRIYVIQPTVSMRAAVKKIPAQKLISLNTMVRNNKIIFDSIIHRDYLIQYMNQYVTETDPTKTQKEILQSLEKRMSDLSVIDKEYLYAGSEIYIVDNQIYILSWKDETCIEINNQDIVSLIKGLFMFAKNHSIKINYHEFIAKHLSKIV